MPQKIKRHKDLNYEADTFVRSLIEEGSLIEGDANATDDPNDIEWFDPTLFPKAKKFVSEYFATIIYLVVTSDTLGFVGKQIAALFFRNVYPQNTCGLRFLSTLKTTVTWLEKIPSDPSYLQQIQRVRKMHRIYAKPKQRVTVPPSELAKTFPPEYTELAKIIKNDMQDVDCPDFPSHLIQWDPDKYFTQLDVAMVLIGPVVPLFVYADLLGIDPEDEGRDALVHMIAVLGRMLGLEDRFNPALHATPELMKKIVDKIGMPSIKAIDETVIFSMEQVNQGLLGYGLTVPGTRIKALLYWTLKVNNIDPKGLWASMNIMDKLSYYVIEMGLMLVRNRAGRMLANNIAKFSVSMQFKMYLKQ